MSLKRFSNDVEGGFFMINEGIKYEEQPMIHMGNQLIDKSKQHAPEGSEIEWGHQPLSCKVILENGEVWYEFRQEP